jgi:hypothetical protein
MDSQYNYIIIKELLSNKSIKDIYPEYISKLQEEAENNREYTVIKYITNEYILSDKIYDNNNYIFTITILNIYNNLNNNIIEYYYDNKNNITTHYFFINNIILFVTELLYKNRKLNKLLNKFKNSNDLYKHLLTFFFNKINIGYINILLLLLNLIIINNEELLNIYINYIFKDYTFLLLNPIIEEKYKKFIINYQIKDADFNFIDKSNIDNFNIYNILNLNLLYSYNNKINKFILISNDDKDDKDDINNLLNKFKFTTDDTTTDIYIIIFKFIYHYLNLEDTDD